MDICYDHCDGIFGGVSYDGHNELFFLTLHAFK